VRDMDTETKAAWKGALLFLGAAALAFAAPTVAARAGLRPAAAGEYLEVRRIEMEGLERISQKEVLDLLEIKPGSGIFGVDLERAGRRLEGHPLAAAVELRRKIPSTLYVRVEERRPKYTLAAGGRRWLMDGDGVALAELSGAEPEDYPEIVVSGLERKRIKAGMRVTDPQLAGIMEVASRFKGHRLFGQYPFTGARAFGPERAVALFRGTGTVVVAPLGQWSDEMERLAAVDLILRGQEAEAVSIDLCFPGKAVVAKTAMAGEESGG